VIVLYFMVNMGIIEELDWGVSRNDLGFFIENQLNYDVAPHHNDWIYRLTKGKKSHRTCTVSSRDHGKTTIVSIGYPLWMITCNPVINPVDKYDNCNVMIVSNSLDQSEDIIEKIKVKIEDTETLQSLTFVDTNKTEIRIREKGNHSKIEAKAFGSAGIRGNHPRVCIVDDPLSETKYSFTYIEAFYFNTISGMIAPTGYMHVVGTRFAYNDLYSLLAEPERGYDYKEYPALDEQNNPLWEKRYSYDDLMQRKREIGNLGFAREYMCQPIDSSSSIFPYELMDKQKDKSYTFEFVGDGKSKYISAYDLARGATTGSDYFVGMTGKREGKRVVITDIVRKRAIGYREQIGTMLDINSKFYPAFHYIENNNYQYVIESIASEQLIPVIGRTTGRQNKENAIFLVRSMLEHDLLVLPYGDGRTRDLIDELILEMTAFGYKNDKLMSVGTHDDLIITLSMLCEAFAEHKKGGFSGESGEATLPLGITGDLDVSMSPVWQSDFLNNLGINNY